MKRLALTILSLFALTPVIADEGMWLPLFVQQVIGDMQSKGFKLSAEDVYSVNQASLKDAVMLFGGGCTGELISNEGLLITNHHCGYGQIQRHSSVEHDYLRDGFWAMSRAEELPCPGLTVSFLDRMEDVTDKVLAGWNESMGEEAREKIVADNIKSIVDAAKAQGNGFDAKVSPLYYGNQYFLYVFRVYRDVRMVGAPPSSIGKFGGETDNWMWPRHTGDFSMFRIYAAPGTNEPAAYSEDNVPYTPKKFFRVSTKGVKEGDFTFIYGNPGSTKEYITASAVKYVGDISNPAKIALRTMRLDAQQKYMSQSQAIRIMYSNKYVGIANAWKKWQGEAGGIKRLGVVAKKQAYEQEFRKWAKGGQYDGLLDQLDSLQAMLNDYMFANEYYTESIATVEWPGYIAGGKKNGGFMKYYHQPIDEEIFDLVVAAYGKNVPVEFRPAYYDEKMAQFGSVEAWRKAVYASEEEAAEFYNTFAEYNNTNIRPVVNSLNAQIAPLMRKYMRAQMEFEPQRTFYPDANLTLRIAYGHVKGYSPADGIYYYPSSSIEGIMQKDDPNVFDYNIPQRLRDIYAAKDYGRWEVNGSVPVCFLATNHTTGGNSGSPAINADGDLVGINFDRVWEGTMSDIVFDPEYCRNISLDIRYALFVIDKVAGAGYLLDEMVLVGD